MSGNVPTVLQSLFRQVVLFSSCYRCTGVSVSETVLGDISASILGL